MERKKSYDELLAAYEAVNVRLEEAEETLTAIRNHEVDALMSEGPGGDQVYTLQGAEQPYRVLVETMAEGAATVTPDGVILYANGRLAEMLRASLNKILGASIHDFIVSQSGQTLDTILFSCERRGQRGEFLLKAADGEEIPVNLAVRPLALDGMESFCIVATDLTEQKRAQEALQESEKRYRTLFNAIDQGFCIVEVLFDENEKPVDYRFLQCNAAFEKQTGLVDAQGKRMRELAPQYEEHWFEIYGKIALTGQPARFENRAEQLHRWYDVHAFRFGQPENRQVAILFDDITERKKTEDVLRRQAALLDLSPDAIMVRDMNGTITFWGRGAELLYGWTEGEARGRTSDLLLKTKFPEPMDQINQQVLLTGHWTGELIHATKDGGEVVVHSRWLAQRNTDGSIAEILESNVNITEQKRIEAQLRQAQKLEAIGTLAGGIAHDFNNILAAMIGFAELAADEIPTDSKAQRHLKRVHQAGLRARELVKQILAFSRKKEGERKQISLTPLVHETHALLRASLPATIQMSLAITTGDDYVLANATQIQQVLMNLATNGAHAMPDGGQLTIGLSLVTFPRDILPDTDMEPGTYVKLTVKDTGTGMTEEVRQRIFEPFFTTKEPGKGTGMGLAVVYGIIKSHGGAVTVTSEVGQGSTFEVFLPRAEKPQVGKEETTISALPTGTERVLFVDDEEMLVEMGREMLESLGYHVTVAKDPTDAWELFLEDPSRFDVIITDQTMPDTTGVTLALKMLRVRPEMPIILCTGHSEAVSADKAKEVGICEFVMKPMLKKELAETIRRALDSKKE